MNSHFPDPDTMRTALALAIRAPSVHNVQPWTWRVGFGDECGLQLFADPARRLVHTDPDGRDLIVSCGAALHHCVVALAALGWQSSVRRLPDPSDRWHVATLELRPSPPSEVDVALAAAIPRRRTDRRHFSPWTVAHGDVSVMGARAARTGVTMRRLEPSASLRAALTRAVRSHAVDRGYLDELTVWSGRHASVAGVPARNVPKPDPAAALPGRLFAGPTLAQPEGVRPADDHGVLLALGTHADDELSRLRAGEATSLVLLTATALGLATCPITEPLEVPETREAIREDAFGAALFPQMLLRVGWAPVNADPLPATPRRPVDDVVGPLR